MNPGTLVPTLLLASALATAIQAAPEAAHGGAVQTAGGHAFEVVFDDHGLHVLPRTPLPEGATPAASVTLRARRQPKIEAPLELVRKEDGSVDHWMLRRDFSDVPDGSRKATIRIEGLGSKPARFSLVLRRPPPGAAPMAGSHSGHGKKAGSDHSMAGTHSTEGKKAGSDHAMAGSHSDHGEGPSSHQNRLLAAREEAIIRAQRPTYPVDWCVVSGDPLGSDGPPIDVVVEGRLVRVCCEGCVESLRESPAKYLAKLDAAAKGKEVARPAGSHSSHGAGSDHGDHDHDH